MAGEIEELYDLERDPSESENLALVPSARETLAGFRGSLVAELERMDGALLAARLPALRD